MLDGASARAGRGSSPEGPGGGSELETPSAGRRWPLAAGAAALVLIAGAAAAIGGGWLETEELEEGDTGVELPEPEELDTEPAEEEAPTSEAPSASAGEQGGSPSCEPEGCERWRTDLVGGLFQTHGGLFIVFNPSPINGAESGGAESDEESAGVEQAHLTAVDAATGDRAWETEFEVERATRLVDTGSRTTSFGRLDERTFLLGLHDVAVAFDVEDQEVRWSQQLPHESSAGVTLAGGEVVLWGERDQAVAQSDPGEFPELDVFGEEGTEAGPRVAVLDGDTGEPLWTARSTSPPTADGTLAVLVSEDGRGAAGVEPRSGEVVWERELEEAGGAEGALWPSVPDGRVLLRSGAAVEILDLDSGDVLATIESPLLDPEGPPAQVQWLGDLVVLREPNQAGPEPAEGAVSIHHLDRPEEPLGTYDGYVDVERLAPRREAATPVAQQADTATAYAVLEQRGEEVTLDVFSPGGDLAWQRQMTNDGGDCCVGLHGSSDGEEVLVSSADPEAPSASRYPVESSEPDGPEPLGTILLPDVVIEDPTQIQWDVPITTVSSSGSAAEVRLVGPGGSIDVVGGVVPHSLPHHLVVAGGSEAIGLDPELLGVDGP